MKEGDKSVFSALGDKGLYSVFTANNFTLEVITESEVLQVISFAGKGQSSRIRHKTVSRLLRGTTVEQIASEKDIALKRWKIHGEA